jgi:hemerythrin superfamily protein
MAHDAVALLEADHQRVESLFRDFRSAGADADAKLHMAQIICMELTLHSMVEEEIFYPAFAKATGDEQLVQHSLEDHEHLKNLIARVLSADNIDGAMEAVRRNAMEHIEEERRMMFPKARACGMELATLGGRIQARRDEVAEAVQEA